MSKGKKEGRVAVSSVPSPLERRLWGAVVVLQALAYGAFPTFLPLWIPVTIHYFGWNRLRDTPVPLIVLALAAAVAVALVGPRRDLPRFALPRSPWKLEVPAAALAGVVFFLLRSRFLNPDSRDFVWKFARDVPLKGAHVTHDEMWELWLHSRFWAWTNQAFGWDVILSYQVLSCVAGAVFVGLLLAFARRIGGARPLLFCALAGSGGYVQLFFGDPENYTWTAVWILAFLMATEAHLERARSLVWPSALLAVAMGFHLVAGFLGPVLAFLHLRRLAGGGWRESLAGVAAFAGILGGTLLFFHFNGLPIGELFTNSHALGHGGDFSDKWVEPSRRYYLGLVNLLFLLAPIAVTAVPLAIVDRGPWRPFDTALALGAGVMLLFMCVWRAQLGLVNDWNLFANVALPVSLLLSRRLIGATGSVEPPRGRIWGLLALSILWGAHTLGWIVANHLRTPG